MNGDFALAAAYRDAFAATDLRAEVCAFPPFPYLAALSACERLALGAQDVSVHSGGAFTGEVSAPMLHEQGVSYVLVGHSERREFHAESSALVAQKLRRVVASGMRAVLCVGESLAQRELGQTEQVIATQLDAVLEVATATELSQCVLAYEPIWAIGTGRTASPEQAQSVHAFLRGRLKNFDAILCGSMRIAYGGSVKESNALALFDQPDIDGALVGGASLNITEFLNIAQSLSRRSHG